MNRSIVHPIAIGTLVNISIKMCLGKKGKGTGVIEDYTMFDELRQIYVYKIKDEVGDFSNNYDTNGYLVVSEMEVNPIPIV